MTSGALQKPTFVAHIEGVGPFSVSKPSGVGTLFTLAGREIFSFRLMSRSPTT